MSILVDKNKKFTLNLIGNFKFLNDEIIGFKLDENGSVNITASFVNRDFETMSKVIEESSIINSVTGKPLLRTSVFTKLIMINFFKELKIESDILNLNISINQETINRLHYDFVKHCAMKWLQLTDSI